MIIYANKNELIARVIAPTDVVLDVGFYGQGITEKNRNWGHRLLRQQAKDVYGLDVQMYVPSEDARRTHYQVGNAEQFDFGRTFDVIYAGDLIEHLTNVGLFLDCCKRHLSKGGKLVLTTPNCYNLWYLTEKIFKSDPTINKDHTCFYERKTLRQLFTKMGWKIESIDYMYSLEAEYRESFYKKILNVVYRILSLFTPKYLESLVVIARTE